MAHIIFSTSDAPVAHEATESTPYLFFSNRHAVYRKSLLADQLYDPYEKVVSLGERVRKLDFYAGAETTSLFALTEAGNVYRLTDVAAEEVDGGPEVNLVEVPFEGVVDLAVNWLDEALIVVWRKGGKSGIAQCAFGNGA